jgi:acetyltransferase AlgX (SGNH hydrolase-like protein)
MSTGEKPRHPSPLVPIVAASAVVAATWIALAEAGRLCREASARFVVFYIPRKFRIYRDHVRCAPDSAAVALEVNDVPARVTAWCQEQSIPFVDLSPALEREVATGRHPHFVDDVHWNARGHEIAAEQALAALERLGIRPGEEE